MTCSCRRTSSALLLSGNDFSGSAQHRHDIISAQHFWTGGLERLGPIMLVMSRTRHAAIVP
jgi:hypothetical protein